MLDAKMVADLITATRGLLGILMLWLGFTQGAQAFPIVVLLMLLDWTGDFVDGGIAHRSRHPRRTRIGDSDIHIDLFVSLCLGIYLIQARYVGFAAGLVYLGIWALIFWRFGLDKNLLMLVQAPIYLFLVLTALRVFPNGGNWLVIWVLAATVINWRRFSREIIPKFIGGMRSLWGGTGKPRSP